MSWPISIRHQISSNKKVSETVFSLTVSFLHDVHTCIQRPTSASRLYIVNVFGRVVGLFSCLFFYYRHVSVNVFSADAVEDCTVMCIRLKNTADL